MGELFFHVSHFPPRSQFLSFIHDSTLSIFLNLRLSSLFISTLQAFNSHPTFMHFHFSFLNLFLSLAFSLFTVTPFFPPAVGQCIFNLVSQTSLKARSSKEKFDISFHPIVSRLQRTALWLVDSQLIKPLAVWHPVRSSGRVTLLNEKN